MNDLAAPSPASLLPPEPEFGAVMSIGERHPEVLKFLALRRSASAATLRPPAPTPGEFSDILRIAARVPDHGKLAPWRFIVLEGEAKAIFAARLEAIAPTLPSAEKAKAVLLKLKTPPLSVVVVSRYVEGNIAEWEQRCSAAAVCMNMIIAAQALGYGANWITDWYAYDPRATALLGLSGEERVAGYIHLGTAGEPPQERVRPDVAEITSQWRP